MRNSAAPRRSTGARRAAATQEMVVWPPLLERARHTATTAAWHAPSARWPSGARNRSTEAYNERGLVRSLRYVSKCATPTDRARNRQWRLRGAEAPATRGLHWLLRKLPARAADGQGCGRSL